MFQSSDTVAAVDTGAIIGGVVAVISIIAITIIAVVVVKAIISRGNQNFEIQQ